MALRELLGKYKDDAQVDALKEGLTLLVQELMEAEVREKTGAERYERSVDRKTYRNGYLPRRWDTRVGSVRLRIPKVRRGSYFPSLLEPRRRTERALLSVVQEAYVHGVSTRKVDDLVRALGIEGISRSEVSRICASLDERMERFRNRPLEGEYPYVWLDAKVVKVREDGRVVNMAVVVAVGVSSTGEREVLGFDVGAAESYGFWVGFLRGLAARGLRGVKLVISDAHVGLRQALSEVLAGASWQRCRVHFMRNLLSLVPRSAQQLVGAWVRTIFAQPDQEAARDQLEMVATGMEKRFPRVAALLREAGEDALAHMAFPREHWRRLHSTNVLERLHREIGRRCDVVGIFPNATSALRLIGAVLEEQQDEWVAVRRYFSQGSMAALYGRSGEHPEISALRVGKEVIPV
ncbi:MAG: IS256 family transposase [Candidatus Bipolaricaulota bacterium]